MPHNRDELNKRLDLFKEYEAEAERLGSELAAQEKELNKSFEQLKRKAILLNRSCHVVTALSLMTMLGLYLIDGLWQSMFIPLASSCVTYTTNRKTLEQIISYQQ